MFKAILLVLGQFDAGTILDYCRIGTDAVTDAGPAVVCDLPVNAKRYATTSSPHHENREFLRNAPPPLYATVGSENGDWDFGETSGVTEIHGFVEPGTGVGPGRGGVEIYCNNLDGGYANNNNSCIKFANGPTSDYIAYLNPVGNFVTAGSRLTLQGTSATIEANGNWASSLLLYAANPPSGQAPVYVQSTDRGATAPIFGGIASGYGIESFLFDQRGTLRLLGVTSASYLPTCGSYAMINYVQSGGYWAVCMPGTGWRKLITDSLP